MPDLSPRAQTSPEPSPSRPAENVDASRRATRPLTLIAVLLVASVIAASFAMKGNGRLDRAWEAAAEYDLIDGVPPAAGMDLAPSDWFERHELEGMDDDSLGSLSTAGVNELLSLGQELAVLSTTIGGDWGGLAHGEEDPIRFFTAFRVGTGLSCIAAGNVPSISPEQRVDALEAMVHLADALSRRHFAGLMIASVLIDQAWTGFTAYQADGLTVSPEQSARLLAALDKLDLKAAAVRAHVGAVATLLKEDRQAPWWAQKAGAARGIISRLVGRSTCDEALALELAVLTQKYWFEDAPLALAEHTARVKELKLDDLPLAESIGVQLHQRLGRVLMAGAYVLAWQVELRYGGPRPNLASPSRSLHDVSSLQPHHSRVLDNKNRYIVRDR